MVKRFNRSRGFTLIELSIVLVIIGLIVGGILVGQDLIRASEVRATITQLERYNTAANTFRDKYGALPGDIGAVAATSFGFSSRTGNVGEGDGNGVIEGTHVWNPTIGNLTQGQGETELFWIDLTWANGMNVNMVDGSFKKTGLGGANWSGASIALFLPQAKLASAGYVYVYSLNSTNYFGLSSVTQISSNGLMNSSVGLTVTQAYQIDQKVDDGLPQLGRVTAQYINYAVANSTTEWAAGSGQGASSATAATPGSATTCYDNNGSAGAMLNYSVGQSGGKLVNCALSFQLQ